MFTGIVEACIPVQSVVRQGSGMRIVVPSPGGEWAVVRGESIAVCGACLTVAELHDAAGAPLPDGTPGAAMLFELSAETLARTWFEALEPGRAVNLERAMQLGDRISGHLVAGHVDGQGRIVEVADSGDGGRLISFEVDASLERYLIEKGSVTLDGISLTVVEPSGPRFSVAVIPLTLELTNLGQAAPGTAINVEADMLGKWIERLMVERGG